MLSGIAIGIITIYVLPDKLEFFLWPMLMITIGVAIANLYQRGLFQKGFWHGVVVGIGITLTHITLTADYLLSHEEEKEKIEEFSEVAPQLLLLTVAPVYWLMLGGLSGLMAFLWHRSKKNN